MLSKLELIINGQYQLYLPAEGITISLLSNEFNLLTNNTAENRPLSITETFEIPLTENRHVFEQLRGEDKYAELKYNDITLIAGPVFEYSADEQKKVILLTITSGFKAMVDAMGDNVFYLDTIDLSRYNYIVSTFGAPSGVATPLRWGKYNPMDTTTGTIELNDSNVRDFCKPSLNLLDYFKELFQRNGWDARWDKWTDLQKKVCLMPTVPYTVSSFGFKWTKNGKYSIPLQPNEDRLLTLDASTLNYNLKGGCDIQAQNRVQPRYPARNMAFRLKAQYTSPDAFELTLFEGTNEIAFVQALGDTKINYITDWINTKEGIDPLTLQISNPHNYEITIEFDIFELYNLVTVYETNEDTYLDPVGLMFPVAENFPQLTPLEIYREFLTLFQMAQTSEDSLKEVDYYFINDIPNKSFERVDVNPYLLWDGYTILSDKINGLAKLNAIRYHNDLKKQRYFKVDIAPLPASGTYFESLFAAAPINKLWACACIPALQYKVKSITPAGATEAIPFEYLEWHDVSPQLAYYDETTQSMHFEEMKMPNIVAKYWANWLTFLSSFDGYTPTVYELSLRLYYYQWKQLFGQRNLFYYLSNALLIEGKYDAIEQQFTGTFLSLR